jgi:hypothetical protein
MFYNNGHCTYVRERLTALLSQNKHTHTPSPLPPACLYYTSVFTKKHQPIVIVHSANDANAAARMASAAAARSAGASVFTVIDATHAAGLTTASTRNKPAPSAAAP